MFLASSQISPIGPDKQLTLAVDGHLMALPVVLDAGAIFEIHTAQIGIFAIGRVPLLIDGREYHALGNAPGRAEHHHLLIHFGCPPTAIITGSCR